MYPITINNLIATPLVGTFPLGRTYVRIISGHLLLTDNISRNFTIAKQVTIKIYVLLLAVGHVAYIREKELCSILIYLLLTLLYKRTDTKCSRYAIRVLAVKVVLS